MPHGRGFLGLVGLLSLLAACSVSGVAAGDWPGWRGPNLDGTTDGDGVFRRDAVGLEVAWTRALGVGYSGISVAGGRVVTMYADGESGWVLALDPDSGDELWRYRIGEMFPRKGGSDGGPSSIPVIDGDTVFGLGTWGHLFAVRLKDGTEIWSTRIDESYEATPPHFGFATTPIVVDDLLFVQIGGSEGRALAAFDRKTGKMKWSAGNESIGYQSPIVATLAGRRQILAVGNKAVSGIDPESGEVLWSREHGTTTRDGSSTPVLLGGDRFLICGPNESAAFRLAREGTGYEVEEVWRTTALRGTFASPVLHDGHLYGFAGDFLTAVNPEDGEKVWKSRPPGGQGVILVDGHLVIYAPDGHVVVAAASPDGYRERARVKVSEGGSYTWPSFAAGHIYVRNLEEIVGIRVVDGEAGRVDGGASAPTNDLERFVAEVEATDRKRLLVDEFMRSHPRFPILEGDDLVHFIYRGDAEDVAITGSMTEYGVEEGLEQIDGTDLFYRSYPIEPGARWEYRFNVDFDNSGPDPLNPRRVPADDGDRSEVLTAGWKEPAFVRPYEGNRAGTLDSFDLDSDVLETTRAITVYLPHGHDADNGSYPLLVVNNGRDWLDMAYLPNTLDHLIGDSIEPVVVAFVDRPEGRAGEAEFGGDKSDAYVAMLADELIPHLESHYGTRKDPRSRATLGSGSGALMAVYAALTRPDVFGASGGQSVYLPDPLGAKVIELAEESGEDGPRFWISWNRYELRRADWGVDFARDSRRLTDTLRENDSRVAGGEMLDSSGWGSWRAHVGDILEEFFPQGP